MSDYHSNRKYNSLQSGDAQDTAPSSFVSKIEKRKPRHPNQVFSEDNQIEPNNEYSVVSKTTERCYPASFIYEGHKDKVDIFDSGSDLIDYYFGRLLIPTHPDHGLDIVDEIWKDNRITQSQRLGIVKRIALLDRNFTIHDASSGLFQRIDYAVKQLSRFSGERERVGEMFVEIFTDMNYPAQKSALLFGGFTRRKDAIAPIEKVMWESNDYSLVFRCLLRLSSLYKMYCPEKLPSLDFDVEERVDPNTIID